MMKKLTMLLMIIAVLPLLLVGCNPPQNRHAKPAEGGTCPCGHDHGAVDHADDAPTTPDSPDSVVVESDVTEIDVPPAPEEPVNPEQPEIDETPVAVEQPAE